MQTKQGNAFQSLHAALDFLDANADVLGPVNEAGARKSLDATVAELSDCVATQTGGTMAQRSATRKKEELRTALIRDHVTPVARIAKAELPHSPELEPLRMPDRKLTVAKLAAYATGMAKAAEPFADVFIASGMPADFIARLVSASDAMVGAIDDRTHQKGAVRGATVAVKTALSRGRKLVGVLDALVKSALKDDPVRLATWDTVKRVQLVTGRPAPSASAPAPATSHAAAAAEHPVVG